MKNRCTACNELLKEGKEVWLELSCNDSTYYQTLPDGHESQGSFPFGSKCAKKETKNTSTATTIAAPDFGRAL